MHSDHDHPPLLITYENHYNVEEATQPLRRLNFNRANYIGLCNFLNNSNILDRIFHKSLEEKVSTLHEVLNEGISLFVPLTKVRLFKNAWWNNDLQKLKNKRNKEWKRFRISGD